MYCYSGKQGKKKPLFLFFTGGGTKKTQKGAEGKETQKKIKRKPIQQPS